MKLMKLVGVVGLTTFLGVATVAPVPTQAKTRTLKVTKVTKRGYHATKGKIYTSTKLTKVRAQAKATKHATLYVTKHAKIQKGRHAAVYYYISNQKFKGWLWHGYLKKAPVKPAKTATKVTTPATNTTTPAKSTVTTDWQAQANQDFLAAVNKYRAQKHAAPLVIDSQFMQLAASRANDSKELGDIDHYDQAGNFIAFDRAPQFGITSGVSECLYMESGNDPLGVGKRASYEYLYDDADSNWGHRDNLLYPESTKIGIGWAQKGDTIYNAINEDY
ncbi:CAP domain-containing protein [Levilactobacillus acidifarinae]|uniref:SCP domain-containing protein n=1 Tax=Levilactobacillus acidifarinae DSM 19394 = JCM 15949 TaxID=1423715 RepID=A0A0R1LK46_9LACO|nr:CAP domain-containing protein [Levilactobacillus acidifarinae]KRK96331.1 hypothetical protein FD25_GL001819 [Levilactobacillus acidifarinae DSM 19394]GEO69086.1 hypothetical protein LAC03_09960 [Levilactobacillus acidifarinae]